LSHVVSSEAHHIGEGFSYVKHQNEKNAFFFTMFKISPKMTKNSENTGHFGPISPVSSQGEASIYTFLLKIQDWLVVFLKKESKK